MAGISSRNVAFTSRKDNLSLQGWYIPGDGKRVLIIINGGFQNRIDSVVDTLGLTRDLHFEGFDILLFDLRGRGDSQGHGRSLLYIDRDLGGAFDYVKSLGYSSSSVGILGFCSGAASACIFASQEDLGALILDGCFASVSNMIYRQAAERHIPRFFVNVFLPGVRLSAFMLFEYREVDPIQVVGQINAPIFFIHEQKDDLTTLVDTQLLFDVSSNSANKLWEIPAALHSEGYKNDPAEYVSRVTGFFQTHLAVKAS